MAPLLSYQLSEKDQVAGFDNNQLRQTVENGLPSICTLAAWEFASRLAAMADKGSKEYKDGVDFLTKIAGAREQEVKVSIYAFALLASKSTPLNQTVQSKILDAGGDDLMLAVSDYAAAHDLRTITPPAPVLSTPATATTGQAVTPGVLLTPTQQNTNNSFFAKPSTYMTKWFSSDMLNDIQQRSSFNMFPLNFHVQSDMASFITDGKKFDTALVAALGNYYEWYAKQSLSQFKGTQSSSEPLFVDAGKALLATIKEDYFKDYYHTDGTFWKNFWGNNKGEGDNAKQLLSDGKLTEFFMLLAKYPTNPLATEIFGNKGGTSFQWYTTQYMGKVRLYYDPGKGLVGRLDDDLNGNNPIVFSGIVGEVSIYHRDLHNLSIELGSDLNKPAIIDKNKDALTIPQQYLDYGLAGSLLVKCKIPFFAQGGVSFAQTPEKLDVIDAPKKLYNVIKKPDLGWTISLTTTNPNTGDSFQTQTRNLMDLGGSKVFWDADLLLGQHGILSDRGADPLQVFTYLKLRDQIILSGELPDKTSKQDLGSYSILYLESGLKSQYQRDVPASAVIMFVPAYQYNFNQTNSLTGSAWAGYSLDQGKGTQSGVDLRWILGSLSLTGGVEWLEKNFSGPMTGKVSIVWSPQ